MTRKLTATITAAFLLWSAFLPAYGQEHKPLQKIYAQLGSGPAAPNGYSYQVSVQSVWKNNWVASLSYQRAGVNPKNLPKDYEQGYTIIFFVPIPDPMPENELTMYSLTAGKKFGGGRNTWFSTEAGLSLVKGGAFTFRHQAVVDGGALGYTNSNYSTTEQDKTSAGLSLKADFTWAFASFAGLGGGVYANINGVQSPVGAEIRLLLGWMGRQGKARHTPRS
jgi:hypothetical protein